MGMKENTEKPISTAGKKILVWYFTEDTEITFG